MTNTPVNATIMELRYMRNPAASDYVELRSQLYVALRNAATNLRVMR